MMRVLAVGAHFDDIELGCGGTLIKHLAEGDEVTMLVVTDSDYSDYNGNLRRTREIALKEGKAASEIIGAKLVCGNLETKSLAYNRQLIELLNEWIDNLEIELIYAHWDKDIHQDHSAIGKSIVSAGRHIPRLLMYRSNWYQTTATFHGNFYVDVSRYIDRKITAVKANKTEYRMRGNEWVQFFMNVNANYGQEIGVKYAECFQVVKYLIREA